MQINIGRFRGGFCVYWTGPDGKRRRHQLASRTRTEAEAEARIVYRAKTFSDTVRTATVADIWQAYRADLGDRPTGRTMDYTGKAILPFFGAHQPASIDKAMCAAYIAQRRQQGRKDGSIWTELGHLQSALNAALKGKAPKLHRPRKPQTDMRILSAAEARALIDAAHDPHIRLAILLLLGTGARVGAILDLTWDRVDLDRGVINLRLPDATTRKGRAVLPMSDGIRAALLVAHAAALSDHVIEYAAGPVKSIRHGFQNAVTRANLGHVTIHELRHTAAVTMLGAGVPIEKVAQVLGHSNLAVTYSTYGRFMPQQMADAVAAIDFTQLRSVK